MSKLLKIIESLEIYLLSLYVEMKNKKTQRTQEEKLKFLVVHEALTNLEMLKK